MTTTDAIELKAVKYRAFLIKDKTANVFTVALINKKGGPIISAPTEEEACEKFEKALKLACAMKNLETFKNAVKNAQLEIAEQPETKFEVEYVKQLAA